LFFHLAIYYWWRALALISADMRAVPVRARVRGETAGKRKNTKMERREAQRRRNIEEM